MANEIGTTGSLSYTKANARASLSGNNSYDGGDHYISNVADVGTTEETLSKGDIGTIGLCGFRNMDATNYVELGSATGVYTLRVDAGKFSGPIMWNASSIFAKANTAGVKVEYLLVEKPS